MPRPTGGWSRSRAGQAALLAVSVGSAPIAAAAPADASALRAQALAATCVQCHTLTAPRASPFASLAGRPAAAIVAALRAYREGQRPGTLMPQLARCYDPAQIDRIAAWFAAQPPGPAGR